MRLTYGRLLEEGNGFVAAFTNGFKTFLADLTEIGQVGTPREVHEEYRNIAPRLVDGHRSARDLKVTGGAFEFQSRLGICNTFVATEVLKCERHRQSGEESASVGVIGHFDGIALAVNRNLDGFGHSGSCRE